MKTLKYPMGNNRSGPMLKDGYRSTFNQGRPEGGTHKGQDYIVRKHGKKGSKQGEY